MDTIYACSDCAIDGGGVKAVHVCGNTVCQKVHEKARHTSREESNDAMTVLQPTNMAVDLSTDPREQNVVLRLALRVPEVWSDEERDGMSTVFNAALLRHGLYESLFAVAAWLLRHRATKAGLTT